MQHYSIPFRKRTCQQRSMQTGRSPHEDEVRKVSDPCTSQRMPNTARNSQEARR